MHSSISGHYSTRVVVLSKILNKPLCGSNEQQIKDTLSRRTISVFSTRRDKVSLRTRKWLSNGTDMPQSKVIHTRNSISGGCTRMALSSLRIASKLSNGSKWQGHLDAQFNLEGVFQDYEQAVQWFKKAADQDNVEAQFNLGAMYHNGQGVSQDYEQTVEWFRKAADQGDVKSQIQLGMAYLNGHGVVQDFEQALVLLEMSGDGFHTIFSRKSLC